MKDNPMDTATEKQLRDLFSMDPEDPPLADVIETHSGSWRRDGDVWIWHGDDDE